MNVERDVMKKILVTGGAVHGKLDSVKIVTNRFQGGRAAALADQLSEMGYEVTWLSSKFSKMPKNTSIKRVIHDGFFDYQEKAQELAKTHDGAVMAAAVANLVPESPWPNKFPSHDYEEGDRVMVPFLVAPRVIGLMRKANPHLRLFGFKLLDAKEEELVHAAYKTLLESGCRAVFANNPNTLDDKIVVMPDRSLHPIKSDQVAGVIDSMMKERFFETKIVSKEEETATEEEKKEFMLFLDKRNKEGRFKTIQEGYVFGAAAMRLASGSILCSARGKNESASFTEIKSIDFNENVVKVCGQKASLNAPLMWRFLMKANSKFALHAHDGFEGEQAQEWHSPGTVEDSNRELTTPWMAIKGHGCFEAWSNTDERIVNE